MLDILKSWGGQVTINGVTYDSINDVKSLPNQPFHIVLGKMVDKVSNNPVQSVSDKQSYRFTVKGYMCKKSTPEFDFMARWNNDNSMPMRTMTGTIEKETKGMVYLNLHGEGLETITCMRCGRELTNPISRYYGIGPECIQKIGLHFAIDDVDSIKEALVDINWIGWCPKSAIVEQTEVD